MSLNKIAVFASGSGTNAEKIIRYFSDNKEIIIDSLWSNKPDAFALERAARYNVKTFTFNREDFYNTGKVIDKLKERNVNLIVLAGFLWLVPESLIDNFEIINIHPALLPKYGGKGMYGMNVHRAVIENNETESGITIHFVNRRYDEGEIIFQAKCIVSPTDTPEKLAKKIHELEYTHYPAVIEQILQKRPDKITD